MLSLTHACVVIFDTPIFSGHNDRFNFSAVLKRSQSDVVVMAHPRPVSNLNLLMIGRSVERFFVDQNISKNVMYERSVNEY